MLYPGPSFLFFSFAAELSLELSLQWDWLSHPPCMLRRSTPRLGFVCSAYEVLDYWSAKDCCIAVRLGPSLAALSLNQTLHRGKTEQTSSSTLRRPDPLICLRMVRIHSPPPHCVLGTYVLQPVWRGREGREKKCESVRENLPQPNQILTAARVHGSVCMHYVHTG